MGIVVKILRDTVSIQELQVQLADGELEKAIHYTEWMGRVDVGDRLLLNTTAVSLSLGSGGFHFIMAKLDPHDESTVGQNHFANGHIMKMRYTPFQFAVQGTEEENSPYHPFFKQVNPQELKGTPVLIGELHSMLPAICLRLNGLVGREKVRMPKVCYIMTDSASLPLAYSKNVADLKEKGLLAYTITIGQAFGGDLECVNIFSALHAAITICQAEVIIITPGPGVVGTGTILGFGGMEQVFLLQGVSLLGGKGIFIPRVSYSDPRERHYGISHHSLTVLRFSRDFPLFLNLADDPFLLKQLKDPSPHHELILHNQQMDDCQGIPKEDLKLLKTMGRNMQEDAPFFLHIFYATDFAWRILKTRQRGKEE